MEEEERTVVPYAPSDNMLKVLRHVRDKALPRVLDQRTLTLIGIPEGNVSRTLAALRYCKLVDDDGRPTPTFDRLERSGDEYQSLLVEIIKAAYSEVFVYANPAEVTDTQLFRAFSHYEPKAQRQRMITLFLGLCREAGLVDAGSPDAPLKRRRRAPTKIAASGAKQSITTQPQIINGSATDDKSDRTRSTAGNTIDNRLFEIMIEQLPRNTDGRREWTQAERDSWIRAMIGNLDLLIKVTDTLTETPLRLPEGSTDYYGDVEEGEITMSP